MKTWLLIFAFSEISGGSCGGEQEVTLGTDATLACVMYRTERHARKALKRTGGLVLEVSTDQLKEFLPTEKIHAPTGLRVQPAVEVYEIPAAFVGRGKKFQKCRVSSSIADVPNETGTSLNDQYMSELYAALDVRFDPVLDDELKEPFQPDSE